MPPGKYLAGGLQSGCTANSTGAQYKYASSKSALRITSSKKTTPACLFVQDRRKDIKYINTLPPLNEIQ